MQQAKRPACVIPWEVEGSTPQALSRRAESCQAGSEQQCVPWRLKDLLLCPTRVDLLLANTSSKSTANVLVMKAHLKRQVN